MYTEGIEVISFVFTKILSLFTCFWIPGTRMTPLEWAVFCLVFYFVIRRVFFPLVTGEIKK